VIAVLDVPMCRCALPASKFAIRSGDTAIVLELALVPTISHLLTAQPPLRGIFKPYDSTADSTSLLPWPLSLATRKTVCLPRPRLRLHVSLIMMLPMVGVTLVLDITPTNKGIVTDDVPRNHHSGVTAKSVIKVQPLKKDEMQPLYAQDMGLEGVTHGFYGSMMQSLGSCIGFIGAVPCCPCPNPFKEVRQGTIAIDFTLYLQPNVCRVCEFSHQPISILPGSVGLVSRFGQFYKAVDPGLVQVNVCTEALRIVDVKIQIISIGRQTVITRDNVNVEM
jgi:hypothetical protein